ncbi:MAG: hypothetical protein AB7Q42_24405 [Acidimicrobiia bacterium]
MARTRTPTIETPDGPAVLPRDHGVVVSFPASHMELDVDDWGRDVHAVRRASRLASLRWAPIVGGLDHIGAQGPALLVCNARRFALTPQLVTWAVGRVLDRPLRFVGFPDTAPIGPVLRRLGGLLADADEIDIALAGGEIVVVGTAPTRDTRRAGAVPADLVEAAWRRHVPLHPVAVLSSPLDRRARIEIGTPVTTKRRRQGPLGPTELADAARGALQKLLDETAGPSRLV